jgi:hypothetical protein
MQTLETWKPFTTEVWPAFVEKYPQFATSSNKYGASHFIRHHKKVLQDAGIIRRAICKNSIYYADVARFDEAAVRCILRLPVLTDNV